MIAPRTERADSRAVRRILNNLLTNALTFTAEGGIVRVDVHFDEGAGIVALSDSGMGFTAEVVDKSFVELNDSVEQK